MRAGPDFASGMKAQAAMEYMITYGWATLVVTVVLVSLYALGLFGGTNSTIVSCTSTPGYLCAKPIMNTSGYIGFDLGQISPGPIVISNIGCSNSSAIPTLWTPLTLTLVPDQVTLVDAKCTSAAVPLGKPFKGSIWLEYTNTANPNSAYLSIGTVSALAVTSAPVGPPNAIVAGPISYASSGTTASASSISTTPGSGASYYFCAVEGFTGTFTTSWGAGGTDENPDSWADIGHQTSSGTCTASQVGTSAMSIAGVAVYNAPTYTLQTSGASTSTPYTINYNVGDSGQYTFILLSGVVYSLSGVSLPSGCIQLQNEENEGYAYVAACSGQSLGPQTVTVTPSSSGSYHSAYVVYSVG